MGFDNQHPLHNPRYRRSNEYDPSWVINNQMGPNALWLTESLTQAMKIERGMRVLDLGCGRAMSSIFLAKEFGVQVWATDLWIDASDNWKRIVEAGMQDRVYPIHSDAHSLPFATGFFDAVVSLDAYHYFGTDDLYIGYITKFLREHGQIGIVVPALLRELGGQVPEELLPFWDWEFVSLHGPEWWRIHWAKSTKVRVDSADALDDGWKDWLSFCELCAPHLEGWHKGAANNEIEMLRLDQGTHLGFTRIVATRQR